MANDGDMYKYMTTRDSNPSWKWLKEYGWTIMMVVIFALLICSLVIFHESHWSQTNDPVTFRFDDTTVTCSGHRTNGCGLSLWNCENDREYVCIKNVEVLNGETKTNPF